MPDDKMQELATILGTAPNLLKQMAPGIGGDPLRLARAKSLLTEIAMERQPRPPCEWKKKESPMGAAIPPLWVTGCGHTYGFSGGEGPAENNVCFCPYCGGSVKVA